MKTGTGSRIKGFCWFPLRILEARKIWEFPKIGDPNFIP